MYKKKNGFTLIEMMVVLLIILGVGALSMKGIPKAMNFWRNYLLTKQAEDMQKGALDYANSLGHFTGVSCETLVDEKIIDQSYGDCTTSNPFGGAIDVSEGDTVYDLVIEFSDVPAINGRAIERKSGEKAVYTEEGGTLAWTFKS